MSENQSISSNSSTMEDRTRRFGRRTYSNQLRERVKSKSGGSVDQTPELIMCEPDPFVLEDESTEEMDGSTRSNGQVAMTVTQLRGSKGVKEEIPWRRKKKVVVPKVIPKVVPKLVGPDEVVHEIEAERVGPDGRIPSNEYVLSKKNLGEIKEHLSSDPKFRKYEEEVVEKKRRREERRGEVAQLTVFHGMHRFRLETLKKGVNGDTCRKCNQDFMNEWDVVAHIKLTHSTYTDPVGKDSVGKDSVGKDRRSDFGGRRDYACTFCCTRFLTINHLARHTIHAHGKETIDPATNSPAEPLDRKAVKRESSVQICDSCGKMFNNGLNGLRNHILSFHTRPEERPYPCDFNGCDRAFARARKLLEHRRVHKDLRLFQCPHAECGKKFVKQQSMNEHVKAIHEKKKFKCRICGHESISSSGRDYHRKKFHEKEKSRKCPHCSFATLTTGNLKLHIKNMHKDRLDQNGQVRKEDEAKFMTFVHHDRYRSSQIIPLVDQVIPSTTLSTTPSTIPLVDQVDSNCQESVRETRGKRRKVKGEKSKSPEEKRVTETTIEPVVESEDSDGTRDPVIHSLVEIVPQPQGTEQLESQRTGQLEPQGTEQLESQETGQLELDHMSLEYQSSMVSCDVFQGNSQMIEQSSHCPMCEHFFSDLTFHLQHYHRVSSTSFLNTLLHPQSHTNHLQSHTNHLQSHTNHPQSQNNYTSTHLAYYV